MPRVVFSAGEDVDPFIPSHRLTSMAAELGEVSAVQVANRCARMRLRKFRWATSLPTYIVDIKPHRGSFEAFPPIHRQALNQSLSFFFFLSFQRPSTFLSFTGIFVLVALMQGETNQSRKYSLALGECLYLCVEVRKRGLVCLFS